MTRSKTAPPQRRVQPSRRRITEEQRDAAGRLKAAFNARKEALGLTQAAVGEALGTSQSVVTQYFNAHVALNTDFVLKVCRLLGVDPLTIDPSLPLPPCGLPTELTTLYAWGGERMNLRQPRVQWPGEVVGVMLPREVTPYPEGAIALVSEGVVEPSLGFITRRGPWRFVEPAVVPAAVMEPLSILVVVTGGLVRGS